MSGCAQEEEEEEAEVSAVLETEDEVDEVE